MAQKLVLTVLVLGCVCFAIGAGIWMKNFLGIYGIAGEPCFTASTSSSSCDRALTKQFDALARGRDIGEFIMAGGIIMAAASAVVLAKLDHQLKIRQTQASKQ